MKKEIVTAALILSASINAIAGVPVTANQNQQELLKSNDPALARNKKLVFDFSRVILEGLHLDQAPTYLRQDYIQHNPNVPTGLQGFLDYFSKLGGPKPIPDEISGLVSIQAEGNFVTLSFVNKLPDPAGGGATYTTTWFDMFRIQDGKIAEHWDCDVKAN